MHAQTWVRSLRKLDCGTRRIEREDRGADIATELNIAAGA